jgi:hypothetical protein
MWRSYSDFRSDCTCCIQHIRRLGDRIFTAYLDVRTIWATLVRTWTNMVQSGRKTRWSRRRLTLVVVEFCPFQRPNEPISSTGNHTGLRQRKDTASDSLDSMKMELNCTWSVSSIRSTHFPPVLRANRWLKSAVLSPPRCSWPVGEGAKRSRGT